MFSSASSGNAPPESLLLHPSSVTIPIFSLRNFFSDSPIHLSIALPNQPHVSFRAALPSSLSIHSSRSITITNSADFIDVCVFLAFITTMDSFRRETRRPENLPICAQTFLLVHVFPKLVYLCYSFSALFPPASVLWIPPFHVSPPLRVFLNPMADDPSIDQH